MLLLEFFKKLKCYDGTHAEVGAYLIGLWGIAGAIVEALELHHSPVKSGDRTFTLVTAVHAANVLANEMYPVETGAGMKMDFDYIFVIRHFSRINREYRITTVATGLKPVSTTPLTFIIPYCPDI